MREINIALLEGIEAKGLLKIKNELLQVKDSIIRAQETTIQNMERANKLTSDNLWHSEARNENCMSKLTVANAEADKWKRRARTYKTIAIISAAVLVGAAGTTYIITQ